MSPTPPDLERLQAEVDKLQQAQMSLMTERGYACDFRLFRKWCALAGRAALPASPQTLNLNIADRLQSRKVTSVCRYAAGIAFFHRREGFPSPVDDSVHKTLRGARRMRAEQPRQMRPMTVAQLRIVAAHMLGLGTPVSIRNRALLLLAFATGLRRSNLTALPR